MDVLKRLKNLSRNGRLALLGAVVLILLLAPVAAFAVDEMRYNGEVARNVTAGDVELGGLGHDDALEALRGYEKALGDAPLVYRIADSTFEISASELGIDIDEEAVLTSAMEKRRGEGFLTRFSDWFGSFDEQIAITIPVSYEPDLLDDLLDEWEQEAINDPAFEGGLIVSGGRVLPEYPKPGEGIDRAAAQNATEQAIQDIDRPSLTLPTLDLTPTLTAADIDTAAARASRIIDSPITLRANDPEIEVEFTASTLAQALVTEVRATEPARVDLSFSRGPISRVLTPLQDQIEQPPRDAEFLIDDEDNVTLRESRRETLLDVDLVVARLFEVADRGGSTGTLPFAFGEEAAFTTEMAEAMGEISRVSQFTTEHSCCEPRVTNIQTMAATVDGAIVPPGEVFDLNAHVGERTRDKGYVPAPQIFEGEIVDAVGGGVSQFATTLFNAMFFGCYEDVEHKAHSRYFSRYPEGREATVSWGGPELIFRNDTDALLIIKTAFTSRSITVKMFGNTGGRECTSGLGDRYAYRDPPVEFEGDDSIPPGTEVQESAGGRGWSIDFFRYIVHDDGTEETQSWTHRYLPTPTIVLKHPCDLEDAPSPCLIAVPDVIGMKQGKATSTLETWSFVVVKETVSVDDEAQDGRVISQSPAAGLGHARGATVTIQIGEFTEEVGDPGADFL
ncbi:MAG: PASTA domain-containing protein [Acidimicrobiia bacterium]|nr:PASTA domain-containing protein [Acidimicrobiia bacterium]